MRSTSEYPFRAQREEQWAQRNDRKGRPKRPPFLFDVPIDVYLSFDKQPWVGRESDTTSDGKASTLKHSVKTSIPSQNSKPASRNERAEAQPFRKKGIAAGQARNNTECQGDKDLIMFDIRRQNGRVSPVSDPLGHRRPGMDGRFSEDGRWAILRPR